jgi:hypothetical protein
LINLKLSCSVLLAKLHYHTLFQASNIVNAYNKLTDISLYRELGHLQTSVSELGHLQTSVSELGHLQTSVSELGHLQTSVSELGHLQTSVSELGHLQTSVSELGHLQTSVSELGHLQTSVSEGLKVNFARNKMRSLLCRLQILAEYNGIVIPESVCRKQLLLSNRISSATMFGNWMLAILRHSKHQLCKVKNLLSTDIDGIQNEQCVQSHVSERNCLQ